MAKFDTIDDEGDISSIRLGDISSTCLEETKHGIRSMEFRFGKYRITLSKDEIKNINEAFSKAEKELDGDD